MCLLIKDDMESAENRFAHLLQPIRELTKNWDIDVASELNDYLEEVKQQQTNLLVVLSSMFDSKQRDDDFYGAALVTGAPWMT